MRKELTLLMVVFLFFDLAYIVLWGTMFKAQVYQWTFIEWPFFACTTIVSFFVLFGAGVFGVICWMGFGKGLAHYRTSKAFLSLPRALLTVGLLALCSARRGRPNGV